MGPRRRAGHFHSKGSEKKKGCDPSHLQPDNLPQYNMETPANHHSSQDEWTHGSIRCRHWGNGEYWENCGGQNGHKGCIDVAVPKDSNVRKKEHQELEKNQDLREQLEIVRVGRIHSCPEEHSCSWDITQDSQAQVLYQKPGSHLRKVWAAGDFKY